MILSSRNEINLTDLRHDGVIPLPMEIVSGEWYRLICWSVSLISVG